MLPVSQGISEGCGDLEGGDLGTAAFCGGLAELAGFESSGFTFCGQLILAHAFTGDIMVFWFL